MVSKTEARERISRLIEKYKKLTPKEIFNYNEANTRKDFIMPLFAALGWDISNDSHINEVVEEDSAITGGRIDYSFRVNNLTKFILEAKAIPEDLEQEKWAKQAVEYGWNKGIPWVILTDFEGLKVFNSEWKIEHPRANIDLELDEYLANFEKLWLLSKESFENDSLDKLLSEFGVTAKRESVNEHLAKDLLHWRSILVKFFSQWNTKIEEKEIEEAVQRILDRLIFMRVVEDRNLEEKQLWQTFQMWQKHEYEPQNFIEKLTPIFREYDKKYNSNLFKPHLCERLYTTQEPFIEILPALYGSKEEGVKYRFDALDPDVLGRVYEQYLGYAQEKKGARSKRKKQGIYYTPQYIVNYLVENTLGQILREENLEDIKKVRVLDPACGSGSLLIKSFELLNSYFKEKFPRENISKAARSKYSILTNNLYGVDLDSKAVEIARLNLLLKALEPNYKLPLLSNNIKIGNSLIKDKKISDEAFDWRKEFLDSFKGGHFSVIVGNPPYIFARDKGFSKKEKTYYYKHYKLTQYQLNTYLLFIEKSLSLLKVGGYLGFIIPNTWLTIDSFSDLRKYLLDNTGDLQIVNIFDSVFGDASVDSCLLICRKGRPSKVTLGEVREGKFSIVGKFDPGLFNAKKRIININLLKNKEKMSLLKKINRKSVQLNKVARVSTGLKAYQVGKGSPLQTEEMKNNRIFHSKSKEDKTYKKYLAGRDVLRYALNWSGEYLSYGDWLAEPRKSVPFKGDRILVRQIPSLPPYSINAVFTSNDYVNDINSMVIFDFKVNPLFILAILNSKLTSFWFSNKFDKFQRKTFPQFKVKELKLFPIPEVDKKIENQLARLAKKLMVRKSTSNEVPEGTVRNNKLQKEINMLNNSIDKIIYKIYDLSTNEVVLINKVSKKE